MIKLFVKIFYHKGGFFQDGMNYLIKSNRLDLSAASGHRLL